MARSESVYRGCESETCAVNKEIENRRHTPALALLLIAVAIWIAIIVYTLTTLVPINNRIARLADRLPEGWRQEHKRWDTYHRWRILSLAIAMVCLVAGILIS